jgi:hypothetical protein
MANEKNDQSVLGHIDQLVKEEKGCTRRRGLQMRTRRGWASEGALDQCWTAAAAAGVAGVWGKPDKAKVRPAKIVENYEQ